MSSNIEQTSALGRRLRVELSWEDFNTHLQKELKAFQPRAKIPGFRPGKAPLNLIDRDYGQIRQDVVRTLVGQKLDELMTKDKVTLAAEPTFHAEMIVTNQPVVFTIDFEVPPTVDPKDLAGVAIERTVAEVTDKDIEETIEQLRQQMRTYEPADTAAADGDKIAAKLTVAVDGADSETYDNFDVTLGEGRMIPGFEAALVGVKAGETREFTVNFPENYQHKPYAGKPGTFTAVVSKVLKPQLPSVDAVFAEKYGVTEGGVEGLHRELRNELTRELDWKLQQLLKDTVFDALYQQNPMEVPQAQVKQESQRLLRNMFNQYTQHMPKAQLEKLFANLDPSMMAGEAKKRVTLSYLVEALVEKYQLKVAPEQVRTLIEQRASMYNEKADIINEVMNDPKLMSEYEGVALEDLLVTQLLSNAKVTDIKKTFSEVMRPAKPAAEEHVHDENCNHDHDHKHDHKHKHEEEQAS